MKRTNSFAWLGKAGIGCLGAALIVVAGWGVSYATENAGKVDRGQEAAISYKSNEAGQTFGSCADAATYDDMPDLVLVVATNGKEGYVYRDALEEAEGGSAEQFEDLAIRTQEQDEAFSEALVESLEESGYQVSQEMIDDFIEESRFGAGSDCAAVDLIVGIERADGADAVSSAVRSGSGAEGVKRDVEEAFTEALRASGEVIPVYDADGTTVIGEFLVAGV